MHALSQLRKVIGLALLLLASLGRSWADERVRQVQEELRKRNVYFGEIDGQQTPETIRALRNYQRRKGFPDTGELDGDTLASLNLAPSIADDPRWPNVAVLKSDAARQMKSADRKRLEKLPAISEPPPIESDSRLPERPALITVQEPSDDDDTASSGLPPKQLEEFVRAYLDDCETNTLAAEMRYYGDRLNYFDHGVVDRKFVERDVAAFYKRWPQRKYELLEFKVLQSRGDAAVVKFRISFRYRSPRHDVDGKTDNVFAIRATGGRLRFTSLREQRLRD
jgi:peptidoglycan hydrolase-like protein with peptidoglycan-binding domain